MIEKICTVCGDSKPDTKKYFKLDYIRNTLGRRCHICINNYAKKRYNNIKSVREIHKISCTKYRNSTKGKIAFIKIKERWSKSSLNLDDSYIIKQFSAVLNIKPSKLNLTPELIELKRQQLILTRESRIK